MEFVESTVFHEIHAWVVIRHLVWIPRNSSWNSCGFWLGIMARIPYECWPEFQGILTRIHKNSGWNSKRILAGICRNRGQNSKEFCLNSKEFWLELLQVPARVIGQDSKKFSPELLIILDGVQKISGLSSKEFLLEVIGVLAKNLTNSRHWKLYD